MKGQDTYTNDILTRVESTKYRISHCPAQSISNAKPLFRTGLGIDVH